MLKRIALTLSAVLLCASTAAAEVYFKGVELHCADLEKSVKFYSEVLGWKIALLLPEGAAIKDGREIVLNASGTRADVVSSKTAPLIALLPLDPKKKEGRTNYGNIAIATPDVMGIVGRVKAAGGTVLRAREGFAMIADPDGFEIEVFQLQSPGAK